LYLIVSKIILPIEGVISQLESPNSGYIIILAVVGFSLTFIVGPLPIASPWIMDLIAFLTAILPVMLYFTLLEGGSAQATWGKRWVGIQVTAVNSQPVTYGRVFVRSFIKFDGNWPIPACFIYRAGLLPLNRWETPQ
jgi:uncharacterized RDD family membrane protein YckC